MNVGVAGFNGERLAEGRRARGLTGVGLAELVGVTPASISQYENSKSSPRMDVLDAIASTLRLPRTYFLQHSAAIDDAPLFWRCRATSSRVARDRAEIRLVWLRQILSYLNEFLDFPSADMPEIEVPGDFRELTPLDIEAAANSIRRYWGVSSGPMPDLLLEIENHGVVVSRIHMGADKQDGFSQIHTNLGMPVMMLSRDKASAVRQRFDAAHELAHIVLHQKVPGRRLNTAADNKILEDQAHYFASCLLLPAETFLEELWSPTLDAFVSMKDRWKVSVGAMIKRCEALDVISPAASRQLWINYGRRGWRTGEPLDGKIEKERPRLLRRSLELLISEKVQSVSQILEALRLNPRDIEEVCDLEDGVLSGITAEARAMPKLKLNDGESNIVEFFRKR